jgi:Domain of unknown function (DUF4397)
MTNSRKLWSLVAGGTLLATAACNETRDTGTVTTKTAQGTSSAPAAETAEKRDLAMVRVVNASPADKAVTIWAGDSVAFADVKYKSTSDWQTIPDDRFNFQIKNAAGAEPLAENRENLQGGGHYTIVALPDQGGSDKRNLRVLDDDLKPVPADKARVRFINGVASDTDVDLLISGREDPLFDGVNFKVEAGWDEIDPAAGTLTVRPDNAKNTLASMSNVKLEGGKSYTFVLTGRGGKYELIKIEDSVAQDPRQQWDANDTKRRVQ